MTDYSDRRKETRKNIMVFALVHDLENGMLLGYLRDLTKKGARVSGKKTLKSGMQLTLSIELPKGLSDKKNKELHLLSKVRRCIKVTQNPDSYEIGFEFTALEDKQKILIEKLIKHYHFQHKEH